MNGGKPIEYVIGVGNGNEFSGGRVWNSGPPAYANYYEGGPVTSEHNYLLEPYNSWNTEYLYLALERDDFTKPAQIQNLEWGLTYFKTEWNAAWRATQPSSEHNRTPFVSERHIDVGIRPTAPTSDNDYYAGLIDPSSAIDTIRFDLLGPDKEPFRISINLSDIGTDDADTYTKTLWVWRETTSNPDHDRQLHRYELNDDFENVIGTPGVDTIVGNAKDNKLFGRGEGDELFGRAGDDTLSGGGGKDYIYGGDDDDLIDGGSGGDTIWGDEGEDRIRGGSGDDTIRGGTGKSFIDGGAGDDTIHGDAEVDEIQGGAGNDIIHGYGGNDIIDGGADFDRIKGYSGNDQISGGPGVDWIEGGAGDDIIYGGEGDDTDIILGGEGDDRISGGGGMDALAGGDDDDTIYGGDHKDIIRGQAGNDLLVGGDGDDEIYGGTGSDKIIAEDGDTVYGGSVYLTDNYAAGTPGIAEGVTVDDDEDFDFLIVPELIRSGPDAGRRYQNVVVNFTLGTIVATLEPSADDEDNSDHRISFSEIEAVVVEGNPQVTYFGNGIPIVRGESGYSQVYGYGGDDTVVLVDAERITTEDGTGIVTHKSSQVFGGGGEDQIEGSGWFIASGGEDNDTLVVKSGAVAEATAQISGDAGDDILVGTGRFDAHGGPDNDKISADENSVNARLYGNGGDDLIFAQGSYSAEGGEDNDQIIATLKLASSVSGGDGDDTVSLKSGNDFHSDLALAEDASSSVPDRAVADKSVRQVSGDGDDDTFYLNLFDWIELTQSESENGGKKQWKVSDVLSHVQIDGGAEDAEDDELIIDLRYLGDEQDINGRLFQQNDHYAYTQDMHSEQVRNFLSGISYSNIENVNIIGEPGMVIKGFRETGTDGDDRLTSGAEKIVGKRGNDYIEATYHARLIRGDRGNDQIIIHGGDRSFTDADGNGYAFLTEYDHDGYNVAVDSWGSSEYKVDLDAVAPMKKILGGKGVDTLRFVSQEIDQDALDDYVDDSGVKQLGLMVDLQVDSSSPLYSDAYPGYAQYNVHRYAVDGIENVFGTAEEDWIYGDDEVNSLIGMGGTDEIHGRGGNDYIRIDDGAAFGDAGEDVIVVSGNRSFGMGGEGDDHIFSDQANHGLLYGGSGDDTIVVQNTTGGYIHGGDGSDTIAVEGNVGDTPLRIYGDGQNDPYSALGSGNEGDVDTVMLDGGVEEWAMTRQSDGSVQAVHDELGTVMLNGVERVVFKGSPEINAEFSATEATVNLSAMQLYLPNDEFVVLYRVPNGISITNEGAAKGTRSGDGTYTWTVPVGGADSIVFSKGSGVADLQQMKLGATTSLDLPEGVTEESGWREKLLTEVESVRYGTEEQVGEDGVSGTLFGEELSGNDGDIMMVYAITGTDAESIAKARNSISANGIPGAESQEEDDDGLDLWDRVEVENVGIFRMLPTVDHSPSPESNFRGHNEATDYQVQVGPSTFYYHEESAAGYGLIVEDGNIYYTAGLSQSISTGVTFYEVEDSLIHGGRLYHTGGLDVTESARVWRSFTLDDTSFILTSEASVSIGITLHSTTIIETDIATLEGTAFVSVGAGASAKTTIRGEVTEDGVIEFQMGAEALAWAGASSKVDGQILLHTSGGNIGFGGHVTGEAGIVGNRIIFYGSFDFSQNPTSPSITLGGVGLFGLGGGFGAGLEITIPLNPVASLAAILEEGLFGGGPSGSNISNNIDREPHYEDNGPYTDFLV